MLVPLSKNADAVSVAKAVADSIKVGDPSAENTGMGPLAGKAQFEKVQSLIKKGIDEGATLTTGGLGRPNGIGTGYFVKPTIFADVRNDMTIAREEIFGPVLCVIPYQDEDEAVRIANDTPYGLSGYISSGRPRTRREKLQKEFDQETFTSMERVWILQDASAVTSSLEMVANGARRA